MTELLALINGGQAVLLGIMVYQLRDIGSRVKGLENRELTRLEKEAERAAEIKDRAFAAKGGAIC